MAGKYSSSPATAMNSSTATMIRRSIRYRVSSTACSASGSRSAHSATLSGQQAVDQPQRNQRGDAGEDSSKVL